MKTLTRFAAGTVLVAALLMPQMAPAQRYVALGAGSMVTAHMNQTVDSGDAHAGQKFTMTVISPYPQDRTIFAGGTLYGHVTRVVSAGQGVNPELDIAIDRLTLADGATGYPQLTVQAQDTQQHSNVTNVAVSALAGMAVGNWIGKAVFNTNAGGAVGAVAGVLVSANRRQNVSLRQGSQVTFEEQRTVALR